MIIETITGNKIDIDFSLKPELRGSIDNIKYPAMVDLKRDGAFTYVALTDKGWLQIGKNTDQNQLITRKYMHIFAGEHCSGDGLNGELYDLLKRPSNTRVWVFDILVAGGIDIRDRPYIDRIETLATIINALSSSIIRSSSIAFDLSSLALVNSHEETRAMFLGAVQRKFEGVVVKPLDARWVTGPCSMVKLKAKDRTVYEVHYIDPTKERIEITVPFPGSINPAVCGVKVSNKLKPTLKVGDKVEIEHQGVLAYGGLRHPVFIGKV